jgi:hypothetical protein
MATKASTAKNTESVAEKKKAASKKPKKKHSKAWEWMQTHKGFCIVNNWEAVMK